MPPDINWLVDKFRNTDFSLTTHAYQEMLNDNLSVVIVKDAIGNDAPKICEDYPNDPRGPSCLILGWFLKTPLHVVVTYHTVRPIVITTYKNPSPKIWGSDLCTRRRKSDVRQ